MCKPENENLYWIKCNVLPFNRNAMATGTKSKLTRKINTTSKVCKVSKQTGHGENALKWKQMSWPWYKNLSFHCTVKRQNKIAILCEKKTLGQFLSSISEWRVNPTKLNILPKGHLQTPLTISGSLYIVFLSALREQVQRISWASTHWSYKEVVEVTKNWRNADVLIEHMLTSSDNKHMLTQADICILMSADTYFSIPA